MTKVGTRPTSIRIFLADGRPDGLRLVEKSNWTGRAVVFNRPQLEQALERDELGRPGVYVLTGPAEDSGWRLYVGEADELGKRLKQHVAKKEFWTRAIAFTSSNESLNKAHVRYLESRLIQLADAANQWQLDNEARPDKPPMSEPDAADAEGFLAEMLTIFPLLGVDAFESAAEQARGTTAQDDQATLYLDSRGANARGREIAEGFVVFKGAQGRIEEVPSIHQYMRDLRQQLRERGVVTEQNGQLVFEQDYRFSSPSTAAGVLVGGAANGRKAWHDELGRSLKTLQEARAEQVPEGTT